MVRTLRFMMTVVLSLFAFAANAQTATVKTSDGTPVALSETTAVKLGELPAGTVFAYKCENEGTKTVTFEIFDVAADQALKAVALKQNSDGYAAGTEVSFDPLAIKYALAKGKSYEARFKEYSSMSTLGKTPTASHTFLLEGTANVAQYSEVKMTGVTPATSVSFDDIDQTIQVTFSEAIKSLQVKAITGQMSSINVPAENISTTDKKTWTVKIEKDYVSAGSLSLNFIAIDNDGNRVTDPQNGVGTPETCYIQLGWSSTIGLPAPKLVQDTKSYDQLQALEFTYDGIGLNQDNATATWKDIVIKKNDTPMNITFTEDMFEVKGADSGNKLVLTLPSELTPGNYTVELPARAFMLGHDIQNFYNGKATYTFTINGASSSEITLNITKTSWDKIGNNNGETIGTATYGLGKFDHFTYEIKCAEDPEEYITFAASTSNPGNITCYESGKNLYNGYHYTLTVRVFDVPYFDAAPVATKTYEFVGQGIAAPKYSSITIVSTTLEDNIIGGFINKGQKFDVTFSAPVSRVKVWDARGMLGNMDGEAIKKDSEGLVWTIVIPEISAGSGDAMSANINITAWDAEGVQIKGENGDHSYAFPIIITELEAEDPAVEASIIFGDESYLLNSHSFVSAEGADAISVTFDNVVPTQASYKIVSLINVDGSLDVNETLAEGELTLNGKGYADLKDPIIFEQGTQYQVIVTYNNGEGSEKFGINGAYTEAPVTEIVLIDGEDSYTLNTHGSVSVAKAQSATIKFGNVVDVESAQLVISPMIAVEGEEGTTFVPGVPKTFDITINTIGYADLNYNFAQGTKYQIDVNITYKDGSDAKVSYDVDGAYSQEGPEALIAVSGDKNAVKFAFPYDEVAPSWTVDILLNGNKTDLEFDDDFNVTDILWLKNANLADGNYTLTFPVGSLMINGDENEEEMSVEFSIANSVVTEPVVEPAIIASLISANEEYPVDLSNGNVSVESATGVTVSFDAVVPQEATYVIKSMIQVEGAESSSWVENETIAEGDLTLHGANGVAEFEEPIIFNQGERYVISIEAKANGEVLATKSYEFNGSYADAPVTEIVLIDGEDNYTLNTHGSVSVAQAQSASIKFGNAVDVESAQLVIAPMIAVEGEEGTTFVPGVPKTFDISINTFGYAELNYNFAQGTKYQIDVNITYKDGSDAKVSYNVDGAYVQDEPEALIAVGGDKNAVKFAFPYEEVAPSWNVDILLNGNKTDLEFDDDFNVTDILWLKNANLADGNYTLTFPVGSLMINGDENEEEMSVDFTIADGVVTEPVVEPAIIAALVVSNEPLPVSLLNGNTSVESAEGVVVSFDAVVPQEATYVVKSMIQIDGEESSSWEENETIAKGEITLHGAAGVAEFEEILVFNQGERYVITIEAKANGEVLATKSYEFNGAYDKADIAEILLLDGEDQIALNTHTSVSVEKMNAVKVAFGNPVDVASAQLAIYPMIPVETEEGTTYVPGVPQTVDLSINTFGYADYNYTFAQGTKYQIDVNTVYKDGSENQTSYTIDGAYTQDAPENPIAVSGDKNAVKFTFTYSDIAPAYNVNILLNGEKVELELDNDWDITNVLWLNNANLSDGDYTITFPVNSLMINGNENEEEMSVKFSIVDGEVASATEPAIIAGLLVPTESLPVSLLNGNTSVESAEGIVVSFDAIVPQEVTYSIKNMIQVDGAESSSWVENETIANGEIALHGAAGVAEFEDLIIFNQGERYVITIEAKANGEVLATKSYEFNGATVLPAIAAVDLISGDEAIALNTHTSVSVETINAIKVTFGNPVDVESATVSISPMATVETEEGTTFVPGVAETYELSINTIGYAECEYTFEQGTKYQIDVKVVNKDGSDDQETFMVDGAYVAPAVMEIALLDGKEAITLNSHSSVSVEKMDGVKVTFGNPVDVESASVVIYPMAIMDTEDGTTLVPGVPEIINLSINTFGYADHAYTFEQGVKYQVEVNITYKDGSEDQETYMVDGATSKPDVELPEIAVNGTTLEVIYPEGTDLGDNYSAKPYILKGEEKININDYYTDNTTGGFFDPLNKIVITLNEELAAGEYSLVIPAGTFIINGGDNNEEIVVPFTVGTTGIAALGANMKNNAIYNLSGSRVNASAKGILIINGKKYLKK